MTHILGTRRGGEWCNWATGYMGIIFNAKHPPDNSFAKSLAFIERSLITAPLITDSGYIALTGNDIIKVLVMMIIVSVMKLKWS